MMPPVSFLPSVLALLLAAGIPAIARAGQAAGAAEKRPDVRALIDKLTEVAGGDVGYSATVTGSAFLPLDAEGRPEALLLLQEPPVSSGVLREIVKQGAAAVPHLIAHLDDRRPTRVTVNHGGGLGGLVFWDEYDYNARTTKRPVVPEGKGPDPDEKQPPSHTVTVGDLCFVALGQIVNRRFNAVRYQPTAMIVVSSPTRSAALREVVRREWGDLTPEKHKALLIDDFLKPDHDGRRVGACKRLAYYYPEALEPLALKFLAEPTYDAGEVFEFVRQKLYKAGDAKEVRALFDAYIARHGEPSREGVLRVLFDDLGLLEAHEAGRLSNPLTKFGEQPRRLLIQLYGKDKGVRSKDQPPYADAISSAHKREVIEDGLIHDDSEKIDKAVRDLLAATENGHVAWACMMRLVGRGYDAEIEKACNRLIAGDSLDFMLDRLGWTRLHVAVDRNNPDRLRTLLRGGARADAAARNGRTPLHLAAARGYADAAALLLDAKAAPDPKDASGLTPVQLASREGHHGVVRLLVDRGCAVSDVLVAAALGRPDRLAELLKADPSLVGSKNGHGQTALHLAAVHGHAKAAEALLDRKADVDARDGKGWTPLHLAAAAGHADVARALLARRADARAALPGGGYEPIHLAVLDGKDKVLEVLLASGADVNARVGRTDASPLHLAVAHAPAGVAKMLLEKGAAVDAADGDGVTPLHVAARAGKKQAAELLLAHKAAVNGPQQVTGYTPLHYAVASGHVEVVKLLLARGADVTLKSADDAPALDIARRGGDERIIRLLQKAN